MIMQLPDLAVVLPQLEQLEAGGHLHETAIFVSEAAVPYFAKSPVGAMPPWHKPLFPLPLMRYAGVPVYVDPRLPQFGVQVIAGAQHVHDWLQAIAIAIAQAERPEKCS